MQYESGEWRWGAAATGVSSVSSNYSVGDPLERLGRVAAENAVVIVSESSCCMCLAVKRLLCGMGVNPTVYELDRDPRGKDVERALKKLLLLGGNNTAAAAKNISSSSSSSSSVVPVVFIGGKLVGAVDRVLAAHINGTLVPLLKQAGALWL